MSRRFLGTITLLALAGSATVAAIALAQPPANEPTVMQRKLTHAQKILEGLAKADFPAIGKAADDLIKCLNDVTWKINETEIYLRHSDQFRREILDVKKAAEKKNLEGVALAYSDMTRSCVRCHQQLRDANR